jgi:hypothetical protein
MTSELASAISRLLARTRQHPYAPDVVAEAAAVVAGRGEAWRSLLDSPAALADLPLSVAGCLLAYAAALQEDGRPAVTARRLEREAAGRSRSADWHARQAAELSGKAKACDPAYRPAFQASAAAHAECASRDRAAAATLEALAAECAMAGRGAAA